MSSGRKSITSSPKPAPVTTGSAKSGGGGSAAGRAALASASPVAAKSVSALSRNTSRSPKSRASALSKQRSPSPRSRLKSMSKNEESEVKSNAAGDETDRVGNGQDQLESEREPVVEEEVVEEEPVEKGNPIVNKFINKKKN